MSMNKMSISTLIAGLVIAGAAASAAPELPTLQYFHNAQPGVEQKLNVAYTHIEELERVIHGLQGENNKRHSEQAALNKRLSGFAARDESQEARIKELANAVDVNAKGIAEADWFAHAAVTAIDLKLDHVSKGLGNVSVKLQHLRTEQKK